MKNCSIQSTKYSKNPDDWKIPCSMCDEIIIYSSFDSYRSAYNRIYNRGNVSKCLDCKVKTTKRRTPSETKSDWILSCSKCGNDIQYKTRTTHRMALKQVNKGHQLKCRSCAATGYEHTEQAREKMRNREYTDEQRERNGIETANRYASMTPEQREANRELMRKINQKRWNDTSPEDKKRQIDDFLKRVANLSPEQKALKNKNISEVKKKKYRELAEKKDLVGEYNQYNPETWKLKCEYCDDFVVYEKLHRYHNAKCNSNKRGVKICCIACKNDKLKCSKNPNDWVVQCTDCGTDLKYDKMSTFRTISNKIKRGIEHWCEACCVKNSKNTVSKLRIYSRNPDDWVLPCGNSNCDRLIRYTTLKGFQGASSRVKKHDPPKCMSCVSKLLDKTTPEWAAKIIGRRHTPEQIAKMVATKNSKSPEQKLEESIRRSIASRKFWDNLTEEEKAIRVQPLLKSASNRTPEFKAKLANDAKIRNIERMADDKAKFRSAYNKNSIQYIENVLNLKYDTEFIHGESENGEFRLWDVENKTLYFADAYCKKYNLWIEIDETNKFSYGKLHQRHLDRHFRIQQILKCPIIRIRYEKHKCGDVFKVYYDDTLYFGNLKEHYKNFVKT